MAEDETWEDLAKRLATLVVKLDERNERLDTWIVGQAAITDRLTGAVERIETTLASLNALITEVFRQRHNGHEA
jgi:hypothetical protein